LPTLPKICGTITLGKLKWQTEPSMQYLHVHFNNHWIATNTTGSNCLNIIKHAISYISFRLYARNVCIQSIPRSQMSMNWDDASRTNEQCESRCSCSTSIYVLTFELEADISSIWCKDGITYYTFAHFEDNNCQSCLWLFNDSLKRTCMSCIDGSMCDFNFPKIVLAHISGEVKNFCTALLSVPSMTCLPIFTEISSYLTNTEQKMSWHVY